MPISTHEAVVYHIELEGRLDPSWSEELHGMSIAHSHRTGGQIVTTLRGELPDQAALVGVLNLALMLRLPLLSVTWLGRRDLNVDSRS